MEKLFTYGMLQRADIQEELFGRKLSGFSDALAGYAKGKIEIEGETFDVADEKPGSIIDGIVYETSGQEFEIADRYEGEQYKRIKVELVSGTETWVYIRR
jgi:hypothetical protein